MITFTAIGGQLSKSEVPVYQLEQLSIGNTDYSELDRATINSKLTGIFNENINIGRMICNTVTGFLGFESFSHAIARFESSIKRYNRIIEENNKNKPPNADAAVIFMSSYGDSEHFYTPNMQLQLEELAKTYYVAFRIIGSGGETLGDAIRKIAIELKGHSIMTLIINCHGNKNFLEIGRNNNYTINNVSPNDFAPLHLKASIIFATCLTGLNLAKVVAKIQPRPVFAYIEAACYSFLTHCCNEHGYGAVAFSGKGNQIARVFTNSTTAMPCCVKNIEKIKQKTLHNMVRAAESGDGIAQFELGCFYHYGWPGLTKSNEEAMKWFLKAAEQGHAIAQYNLSLNYEGVPKFTEEAMEWCIKAAEQGHAEAQYIAGLTCHRKSDRSAAKWYLLAAKQGHVEAQFNLGHCYYSGVGTGAGKSYKDAVIWLNKAAKQGCAEAQNLLGDAHYFGNGVRQNYEYAVRCYKLAANQGNAQAQFNLASCFTKGEGVLKSLPDAKEWYEKAAKQGLPQAQFNLAIIHTLARNTEIAIEWIRKAAAQGYTKAQDNLDCLLGKKPLQSFHATFSWE